MKKLLKSKKAFFSQLFEIITDLLSSGIIILILAVIFIGLTGTFFIGDSSLDDNEATVESFIHLINFIEANKEKQITEYDYGITIQHGHLLFNLPFSARACSKYNLVLKNPHEKYPECFTPSNNCLCICKLGSSDTTLGRKKGDEFCENQNLLCSSQYYDDEESNKLEYQNQEGECVQIPGVVDQQNIGILKTGKTVTICDPGKSSKTTCTSNEEGVTQLRLMKILVDRYRNCLDAADVVKKWNDPESVSKGFIMMAGSKKYDEAAFTYTPDLTKAKRCDTEFFQADNIKIPRGYKLKITYDGYVELYKDDALIDKSHIFFYKGYISTYQEAYKNKERITEENYDNTALVFLRYYELREYKGKKYREEGNIKNGPVLCFSNDIHKDYYDNEYALWLDEGDEYTLYDIGFTQFGVGMVCIASPTGEIRPANEQIVGVGKELSVKPVDSTGNCPTNVNKAPEFIDLNYPGKQSKLWIPVQARCGGTFPLFIPLHGHRDSGGPLYNIYLDNKERDKQFNLIAQEFINKGKSAPLIIAAPMDNKDVEAEGGYQRWEEEDFDINTFLAEVRSKLAVYNIQFSSVSMMGHSNALCHGGLKRAAAKVPLYLIGLAEGTCDTTNYGKEVAEASANKNAIIMHMYNFRDKQADLLSSEYLRTKDNFEKIPTTYQNMYIYARKHPTMPWYSFHVDGKAFSQDNFRDYPLPVNKNNQKGKSYSIHGAIPGQLFKEVLERFFNPSQVKQEAVS